MTVKEGLAKIASVLGVSVKKIAVAIGNASLIGLLKIGIMAGVAVAVVVAIFKFFKDKREAFLDEEEKTPVDRAVQVNMADLRNQKELHPMMKKVNKHLRKELKPRKVISKKLKKGKKAKYKNLFENIDFDSEREELEQFFERYDRDVENEKLKRHFDRFVRNMEREELEQKLRKSVPSDRTLYNVWHSA